MTKETDPNSSSPDWSPYSGKRLFAVFSAWYVGLFLLLALMLFINDIADGTSDGTESIVGKVVFLSLLVVINIGFPLLLFSELVDYRLLHGSYRRSYPGQTLDAVEGMVMARLERGGIEVTDRADQGMIYPRFIPGFLRNIHHMIETKEPSWVILFLDGKVNEEMTSAVYVRGATDVDAIREVLGEEA